MSGEEEEEEEGSHRSRACLGGGREGEEGGGARKGCEKGDDIPVERAFGKAGSCGRGKRRKPLVKWVVKRIGMRMVLTLIDGVGATAFRINNGSRPKMSKCPLVMTAAAIAAVVVAWKKIEKVVIDIDIIFLIIITTTNPTTIIKTTTTTAIIERMRFV